MVEEALDDFLFLVLAFLCSVLAEPFLFDGQAFGAVGLGHWFVAVIWIELLELIDMIPLRLKRLARKAY